MSTFVDEIDPWEPREEALAKAQQRAEQRNPNPGSDARPVHSETSPLSPAKKAEQEQERARKEQEQEERRRASVSVAYAGKPVDPTSFPPKEIPPFPEDSWDFNYLPSYEVDYSDLSVLNRDINGSRYRLFHANRALKDAQRNETLAKIEYRRAFARVMAGLSGGSEKQRQAIADLHTEEEYAALALAEQVTKEYESLVRQLRVDLDSLAGISHNIRAQINIM